MDKKLVCNLSEVGIDNVAEVGGKNASLGEMIKNLTPKGVRVPGGFVVTAEAYRFFLRETKLDEFIKKLFRVCRQVIWLIWQNAET